MNPGRIVLALLIALSVALLPAAGGAVAASSPVAIEHSDCCPSADTPCDKAMDGCASMAPCALKCFSLTATPLTAMAVPAPVRAVLPMRVAEHPDPQRGVPPFRPPRI